jgi:hypothetical protein
MDSDLINISLNQGRQFKNYQKKIKTGIENIKTVERSKRRKEGFSNQLQSQDQTNMRLPINDSESTTNLIQQRDDRAASISKANQNDLTQLTNLKNKYFDLQTQYNETQKKINDNSLVSINRSSANNPYLNKNIVLSQNTDAITDPNLGDTQNYRFGGYVTAQGMYKSYSRDTWNGTMGQNGCPSVQKRGVGVNEYSSSLLSGQPMIKGQSCGNEGKNVYVSRLITNPGSSYIGCYNDKPAPTLINAIPIMDSSNYVNNFSSNASSMYQNNNASGAWNAFDQNPNTFWHTAYDNLTKYNAATGVYEGKNEVIFTSINSGILTIKGEFLQINMPGINTDSVQNMKVTQYSITPRGDNNLFLQRSPNTWYLLGYKIDAVDGVGKWYEVDRQVDQTFTSASPKTFLVKNPDYYGAYIIITEKVGNSDQTTLRDCLQIAELNLFVSSDDLTSDSDRAMIYNSASIGYTTYSECEQYAMDSNFQYFGLQDLQADGTAKCVVSNDYDNVIGYGDGSENLTMINLWSSNTTGQTNIAQVLGTGQLSVYDINYTSTSSFMSNEVNPDCANWGTILIDSATYGGNCSSNSVPIGNVTDKVGTDLKCNYKDSCSIPISNGTFGDPASGCVKAFDIAYKCGGNMFTRNLNPAEGQTMILDCNDYMKNNCQYVLILQDDGDLCLYKGKDPDTKTDLVWSSGTKGLQKEPNPDWSVDKGKNGRNYLANGESLAGDEWISSNSSTLKLIMQKDGNLVLYTSETKAGCSVKDNKTYGSNWINAVYKIEPTGNRSSLGKVAYIDSDANLKEYPSSLLSYSNQYQLLNDFDSAGNDLQQIETSNKEQGCIDACNANGDCAGFVYQPNGNMCYLKSSAMYPSGEKQFYSNSGIIMGVRKPQIGSSVNKSCSRDIVDIDSIQYDNYIKGDPMTLETTCGTSVVLGEDKNILTNLQNSMLSVGQQIADQTNNLYTKNRDINNTMEQNSVQFNKNVDMYKANDNKIKSELNLPGKFQTNNNNNKNTNLNKKEGMRSIDPSANSTKMLTMNDVNSMLSDTDIRVLQENYSYIFWSILAVGLLTITVNQIKK